MVGLDGQWSPWRGRSSKSCLCPRSSETDGARTMLLRLSRSARRKERRSTPPRRRQRREGHEQEATRRRRRGVPRRARRFEAAPACSFYLGHGGHDGLPQVSTIRRVCFCLRVRRQRNGLRVPCQRRKARTNRKSVQSEIRWATAALREELDRGRRPEKQGNVAWRRVLADARKLISDSREGRVGKVFGGALCSHGAVEGSRTEMA